MTSDGQPAPPARLHPATAVICADRPVRAAGGLSGATPGALEAFLALSGLRTLALRLSLGCRLDRVVEAM